MKRFLAGCVAEHLRKQFRAKSSAGCKRNKFFCHIDLDRRAENVGGHGFSTPKTRASDARGGGRAMECLTGCLAQDIRAGMFFLGWFFFALLGAIIGQRKGIPVGGFLLGLLLGPIGCLLAVIARGRAKVCPGCGESVRPEALICRYCRTDISASTAGTTTDVSVARIFWAVAIFGVLPVGALVVIYQYSDHKRIAAMRASQARYAEEARITATPVLANTAPAPKSEAFQIDVGYSQRAAVAKYPALGVKGSAFNAKFLARLAEWRKAGDPRLEHSDWPERLASECAR